MNDRNSCSRLTTPDTGVFQQFDAPLAPNASVQFSLTVPWNEWRISQQTGVYVVGVVVRGTPQDQERLTVGRARTLMPVIGDQPLTRKVNTALVIPLRHRPTLLGGKRFTNDSLAESMAPTGRLGRLLALGNARKVTWLVDPATLDEARRIVKDGYEVGDGSKPTPGTGQAVVNAWLKEFDASRPAATRSSCFRTAIRTSPACSTRAIRSRTWSATRGSATEGSTWRRRLHQRSLAGGRRRRQPVPRGRLDRASPARPTDDVNLVSSGSWPAVERPGLTADLPGLRHSNAGGPAGHGAHRRGRLRADGRRPGSGHRREPDPGPAAVRGRDRADRRQSARAARRWSPYRRVAGTPTGRATAALAGDLSLPWINATSVEPGRDRHAETAGRSRRRPRRGPTRS